jgi:hypothetical protein
MSSPNNKYYATIIGLSTFFGLNVGVSLFAKPLYDKDPLQNTDVILIDFYKKLIYGGLWPFSALMYYIIRKTFPKVQSKGNFIINV